MILSSVSIVWADDNPLYVYPLEIKVYQDDLYGTYNTFKQITVVNTSNSTVNVTCKTKIISSTYEISDDDIAILGGTISIPPKSEKETIIVIDSSVVGQFKAELLFCNNLNSLIKKVSIYTTDDVSDNLLADSSYMPLIISPSEINLTGTLGNQPVSKIIKITDNKNGGIIKLTAKAIYGCKSRILGHTKLLSLNAGESKDAYIFLTMPDYVDAFQVNLEMSRNNSSTRIILPIYNVMKMLTIKNVKASYNYYTKNYTITWDPLPCACSYRLYNGAEYEVIQNGIDKYVINNVTLQEAVNLRRTLVAVNGSDTKISCDSEIRYYEYQNPYFPAPTNVKVKYDSATNEHIITWDPPQGAETNKYQVCTKANNYVNNYENGYWIKSTPGDYREVRVSVYSNPIDRIYTIRAQSPSGGWSIPWTFRYVPAPQNMNCVYDSATEECKLTWQKPSSSVESFMVYSSYNGSLYLQVFQTCALSYTKYGIKSDDKTKYRFKVVPVGDRGSLGEGAEISLTNKF